MEKKRENIAIQAAKVEEDRDTAVFRGETFLSCPSLTLIVELTGVSASKHTSMRLTVTSPSDKGRT